MKLLQRLIPSGCALFTTAVGVATPGGPQFSWDAVKFVYSFGDSYSFVQGTRGTANFSFIGDAQNLAFTPEQLLTTEIVPRKTSSDGSNWLEFLTGCLEGLPTRCTRQLWDFAFAGADIDGNLLPLHHPFTVPLVEQVQQWAASAADVVPHPAGATLATWWIGINDTGDTVGNASITDFSAFWRAEMASYFAAVQTATEAGLRAHLFLNVPPEERAPGTLGDAAKAALLAQNVGAFNAALAESVAKFAEANPDTTVVTFDAHAWFTAVLDDPLPFGFTNTTGFCTCADPTGFFWFDQGHPTAHVHRLLAQAVEARLRTA
ncbi:carbohydrate esterase family 16 protein [Hypholoma sublateritium FD-334 SS-4]|uniref:Carbohydrate esterase family 16 protein n=1 Tax=Hypholoma sublateritium (strain FD-334 SS-4) TaxID=945553 RepID=A0A0D2KTN2_HYPSF|nr:carbohydrate esterase family 16 protein [Hypholoma sublateritium FD-334 SS-4]